MKQAIDVSNYTGPITPEQMAEIKAAGITKLIAGTQVPSVCWQQLLTAKDAGLLVEAYLQLDWSKSAKDQIESAAWAVGGLIFLTERLWIVVENPSGLSFQAFLGDAVREARRLGFNPGIYTNRSSWVNMIDEMAFKNLPLWWAHYDGSYYDAFAWRRDGFGGWWHPAMKQWAKDRHIAGVLCDLNVY